MVILNHGSGLLAQQLVQQYGQFKTRSTGDLATQQLHVRNGELTQKDAAEMAPVAVSAPLVVQFFIGYQGLRSHEYVVGSKTQQNSRGYKSELIWNSFKNLLLGANISGQLKKLDYLLQVNTSLNLGANFSYDYDWLYKNSVTQDAISNYSRHDTVQNIMIELLFHLGFPLYRGSNNSIYLGPSMFVTFSHWDAFNGELRYFIDEQNNNINSTAKTLGRDLSYGILLLSFQAYIQFVQNFTRHFEMRLAVAYSPLTLWLDKDNHYQRSLIFYDYGFWGQQIFGELQWNIWNAKRIFGFSLAVTGRYLFETRGGTLLHNSDADGALGRLLSSSFLSAGIEQGSFQAYIGILFAVPSLDKNKK